MKNFEKTVRAMSAKQIIMAMVKGLRHPKTTVRMGTFGGFSNKGICYGCTATNAIYTIAKVMPDPAMIGKDTDRAKQVNAKKEFLLEFESAIDYLRQGNLYGYNLYAKKIGIATRKGGEDLPALYDDYTATKLAQYVALANFQGKPNGKDFSYEN